MVMQRANGDTSRDRTLRAKVGRKAPTHGKTLGGYLKVFRMHQNTLWQRNTSRDRAALLSNQICTFGHVWLSLLSPLSLYSAQLSPRSPLSSAHHPPVRRVQPNGVTIQVATDLVIKFMFDLVVVRFDYVCFDKTIIEYSWLHSNSPVG